MNAIILCSVGRSLGAVAAIVGAIFLAYHEQPGWGWFLFVAALLGMHTVTNKRTED